MKFIETAPRIPVLSFRDLELHSSLLHAALQGARVERVFIPALPLHPDGYCKRTFVLDLHLRNASRQLYVSLRSGECGVVVLPAQTLRPAPTAPKSGFELALAKHLPGTKIREVRQVPKDRVLVLGFQGSSNFTLSLLLIPGKPVGILSPDSPGGLHSTDPKVQTLPHSGRPLEEKEIAKIPFRPEWLSSLERYAEIWRTAEDETFLRLRFERASKFIAGKLLTLEQKIRSLRIQQKATEEEENWGRYGKILQSHLHENPVPAHGIYELEDPETGEICTLPSDPKLGPKEQLNRYFHQEKRKRKRLSETLERIMTLEKDRETLKLQSSVLQSAAKLSEIEAIEGKLGISGPRGQSAPGKLDRKIANFTGRTYRSREGLVILAGRNREENLLLTFTIAKGNDLWLHVRGRPGSHTVILLPPKRTASLETLLDAAHLCILHSGGKDWGKTNVDYTFRKNVKKIKNHTEVSYSGNKTLSIVLEEERIKRLQAALE